MKNKIEIRVENALDRQIWGRKIHYDICHKVWLQVLEKVYDQTMVVGKIMNQIDVIEETQK